MKYRHDLLARYIIQSIPKLVYKDQIRDFSDEQGMAIYFRDKCICQLCHKKCSENDFHADHKIPHKSGGQTKISNGQLLCPECNLKKSGNMVCDC